MVQHATVTTVPDIHHELMDMLKERISAEAKAQAKPFRRQVVWFNLLGFLALHLLSVYGLYVATTRTSWATIAWSLFLGVLHALGVTMGAHRLYSHKAFKAKAGLRFFLVFLQTMAGQNCMYIWVRDHRQHHKYSDTDGDPHNASRGFFFSHIGWLMSRKHPDVIAKGKGIDMSDIEQDPFVMFQKKYYKTLYTLFALGLPVAVPCLAWGEDLEASLMTAYLLRTIISLNLTWCVNSAAHKFGYKPYSKEILPVECEWVSLVGMGEGWHNYHHSFPWDYKAAELGQKWNLTTTLLDMFERWGWVYDLRSATPAMVQRRVLTHGDGSHPTAPARDPTPPNRRYQHDQQDQPAIATATGGANMCLEWGR